MQNISKFFGFLILFFFVLSVCVAEEDSHITKFMRHLNVIPDVIDIGPKEFLNITYENNIHADKGVELTPTQTKYQPKVTWAAASNETFYTLLMTDPDAPSREAPLLKEWHHWLVVNIPGNDVANGEVLSAYIGLAPPKNSGLHRYVFLVYEQNEKQRFLENRLPSSTVDLRHGFSTRRFIERHNLKQPPVAGNFFSASHDAYSDELTELLSQ